LAFRGQEAVGLAVCFFGFSTFAARPLLNIHDLIVHPADRRTGVAAQIMAHVEQHARNTRCCKITLEVRCDNAVAKGLYSKFDFTPGDPPYEFWTKTLEAPS
jgi:ribosomal protein S18 acetylase RimI-like enzyme